MIFLNELCMNNILITLNLKNLKSLVAKIPWRKYRIGIHSQPIRTNPIHSGICIRANANDS